MKSLETDYIKSYKKEFNEARNSIQIFTRHKMGLTHLVKLKHHVLSALEDKERILNINEWGLWGDFAIGPEIVTRYIMEEYGIDFEETMIKDKRFETSDYLELIEDRKCGF